MRKANIGMIAILLIFCFVVAATPASASTVRFNPTGTTIVNWWHIGLVFNVDRNTLGNDYCIGGVDQATVNKYVSADHKDVQKWDILSYGAGKSVLLVPKTYVLHRWNFANEIYIEKMYGY